MLRSGEDHRDLETKSPGIISDKRSTTNTSPLVATNPFDIRSETHLKLGRELIALSCSSVRG
jgi:hypothetical protein